MLLCRGALSSVNPWCKGLRLQHKWDTWKWTEPQRFAECFPVVCVFGVLSFKNASLVLWRSEKPCCLVNCVPMFSYVKFRVIAVTEDEGGWTDRLNGVLLRLQSSGKCVIISEFPRVPLFNIVFWHTTGTVSDMKCKSVGAANAGINHANWMQFLVFPERFQLQSHACTDLKVQL